MADPFIGEIKMFSGNYAPRNYACCDGQILAIAQNQSLFALINSYYGGDGRTTMGLPDMRSRVPIHQGTGPGLTNRPFASKSGTETVVLGLAQMPSHSHTMEASINPTATSSTPSDQVFAETTNQNIYSTEAPDTAMSDATISTAGGGQAHYNIMPYTCINFIIALAGTFPSRN